MNSAQARQPRSRWGRSRFGWGGGTLIAASTTGGAVVSSALGWLARTFVGGQEQPWLLFTVVAVVTLPISAVGIWALLVDRSTIAGAVEDPDESVESRWYDKAATGAFHVLIVTLGLGLGVFSFLDVAVSPSLLLGGLFGIAAAAFGACYLLAKRADG